MSCGVWFGVNEPHIILTQERVVSGLTWGDLNAVVGREKKKEKQIPTMKNSKGGPPSRARRSWEKKYQSMMLAKGAGL